MQSHWDERYRSADRLWGEGPSELALTAGPYLHKLGLRGRQTTVLDLGCGYGRDAFYLHDLLGVAVLGVDSSPCGVEMARDTAAGNPALEFRCCSYDEVDESEYPVVLASNIYHLLPSAERARFRETVARLLEPRGLLFLSTMSPRDPQHFGKGSPVPDEQRSFMHPIYLHFATQEELLEEFAAMHVRELFEHDFVEPHLSGDVHHHVSWILIAEQEG